MPKFHIFVNNAATMYLWQKIKSTARLSPAEISERLVFKFRTGLFQLRIKYNPGGFIASVHKVRYYFLNDWISYKLFSGTYDREEISVLSGFLDANSLFADIGANTGAYCLSLSIQTRCRCIAFEPSPREFELLKKNIALNNLASVTAYNLALGDKEGKADFYIEARNNGINTLTSGGEGSIKTEVEVRILDSFMAETDLSKIRVIKIDVEGFETEVLQGAKKLLETYHPVILYESLAAKGLRGEDLIRTCSASSFLKNAGYTISEIRNGKLVPAEESTVISGTNLLAVFS